MTPTPSGDSTHRHRHRPLRRGSAPARTTHSRRRAATGGTPVRGSTVPPDRATLWPFADADPLPGTTRLAGWLGRTIVTLVTGYTSPGDRVLLLAPPTPPGRRSPAARRAGADPYVGLTEAVWTVTRLGRSVDTATAVSASDCPCDPVDSPGRAETESAESGSRPRPSRLGLHTPTDRCHVTGRGAGRESQHHPGRAVHRPRGGFDLIITAVHPHVTDWLAHTDWDTVLTPTGTLATITHSDNRPGRLLDPTAAILSTVRSQRRGWLDHIAILHKPLPVTTSTAIGSSRRSARRLNGRIAATPVIAPAAEPLVPRAVHHDLLLFGPVPTVEPTERRTGLVAAERGETSDG